LPDDIENSVYRSFIQKALQEEYITHSGKVQAVVWTREGVREKALIHEKTKKPFAEANDITTTSLSQIIMNPEDLELLRESGTTVVFIKGLDDAVTQAAMEQGHLDEGTKVSGAHYSLSRNQIYLDSRFVSFNKKLHFEFRRQLHHELQERIGV